MQQFTCTDNVISLRPFRTEDAATHLQGEDEEIRKWLNDGHTSTLESVQNMIRAWRDDGDVFTFAIWTVEDQTLIGLVEARTHWQTIEGLEADDANISYCLYPAFRGKGFMSRAVDLIEKFLKTKDVRRMVIRIDPDNENSLKVPARCGFKRAGFVESPVTGTCVIFTRDIQ